MAMLFDSQTAIWVLSSNEVKQTLIQGCLGGLNQHCKYICIMILRLERKGKLAYEGQVDALHTDIVVGW